MTLNLFAIVYTPVMLYSCHVSQSYFAGQPETLFRTVLTVGVALAFIVGGGRQILRIAKERKLSVLGLEGELATGEELNQLMLEGCRVFHDIPYPYGNIDHVVVSRSGVYSVNSKLRGKPRTMEPNSHITVDQEQGIVHFPGFACRIPVATIQTEAHWLSNHLTSAVGQPVKVEPLLALPGWFIKERIGRGCPVYVINPRNSAKFFVNNRQVLAPEQIQQVAHQLDQLCRDIEPSFRPKRKRWEDKK